MIAIIDYDMGNLRSIFNSLSYLSIEAKITSDKETILSAEKIILPGVGSFKAGIESLRKRGLIQILSEAVLERRKEILGICLGMQLFCKEGYEEGQHSGLNWIDCSVRKLKVEGNLRVPHMGWNNVKISDDSQLLHLHAKNEEVDFYFVHSYYLDCLGAHYVTGTCEYGMTFPAMIEKENVYGTQFHPEKSQARGLEIINNFATL
jgi:glutamine amidotransferase